MDGEPGGKGSRAQQGGTVDLPGGRDMGERGEGSRDKPERLPRKERVSPVYGLKKKGRRGGWWGGLGGRNPVDGTRKKGEASGERQLGPQRKTARGKEHQGSF